MLTEHNHAQHRTATEKLNITKHRLITVVQKTYKSLKLKGEQGQYNSIQDRGTRKRT